MIYPTGNADFAVHYTDGDGFGYRIQQIRRKLTGLMGIYKERDMVKYQSPRR
jgi:hypothetical protein